MQIWRETFGCAVQAAYRNHGTARCWLSSNRIIRINLHYPADPMQRSWLHKTSRLEEIGFVCWQPLNVVFISKLSRVINTAVNFAYSDIASERFAKMWICFEMFAFVVIYYSFCFQVSIWGDLHCVGVKDWLGKRVVRIYRSKYSFTSYNCDTG